MADANDGRVTLWRANDKSGFAPRWWERKPINDIFFVEGVWRPRADDDALLRTLMQSSLDAGAWKARATKAEADRDRARALLKEARVAVDLWTDDHRCGEDVSLKPEYAAQLRARIDAETRGEGDASGTRRDDETASSPTDTTKPAPKAGNGGATPP